MILKHSINGAIIKIHILTKPKESIWDSKVYFGIHVNINKTCLPFAQQNHTSTKNLQHLHSITLLTQNDTV